MNILEYIKHGGKCKSKSGHWFRLKEFVSGPYPISGFLVINGKSYPYSWSEDGSPENLPYTHGLDLMPVIPVTHYKMVNKNLLSRYVTRQEFEHDAMYL